MKIQNLIHLALKQERLVRFCSLFFAILLTSCSEKLAPGTSSVNTSKVPATKLWINELEGHNLSEDMSIFSTHNDEITFFSYLFRESANSFDMIEEQMFDGLKFDSLNLVHSLDHTFDFPVTGNDGLIAAFVLIEMDNNGTEEKIADVLRTELASGSFLKHVDHVNLDTLIGDDDFLGLRHFDAGKLKQGELKEIRFSGLSMFDRYRYTFRIEGR